MATEMADPFATVAAPNYSSNWWESAQRAGNISSPEYSSPGDYQTYNDWNSWVGSNGSRQAYSGEDPVYKALAGNDYARLEDALKVSGEQSAKTAYDRSLKDLMSTMYGRGTYGSSAMANTAQQNVIDPYISALATNAASATSNRYAFEQADNKNASSLASSVFNTRVGENTNLNQMSLQELLGMNSFNQNQDAAKAGQMQNLNSYNLSRSAGQNAANQQQYQNQFGALQYDNELSKAGYTDAWTRAAWDSDQADRTFNNAQNWYSAVTGAVQNAQKGSGSSGSNSSMSGLFGGLGSVAGAAISLI